MCAGQTLCEIGDCGHKNDEKWQRTLLCLGRQILHSSLADDTKTYSFYVSNDEKEDESHDLAQVCSISPSTAHIPLSAENFAAPNFGPRIGRGFSRNGHTQWSITDDIAGAVSKEVRLTVHGA